MDQSNPDLPPKTTYCHLYIGGGRATLALRKVGQTVTAGIAFCSPKDNYRKAEGRRRADERLAEATAGSISPYSFQFDRHDDVRWLSQIMGRFRLYLLENQGQLPQWAKDATAWHPRETTSFLEAP